MAISKLRALAVAILLASPVGPAPARAETSPDQAIQREQYKLRRNSRDAGAYHRLGDAYAQKARETGDLSYLTLAEKALRKALEITPGNAGAARHLAYVFPRVTSFAKRPRRPLKAIELDPKDGDAYGVLGDAYLELGRYDRAGEAYDAMMRPQERPRLLWSAVRAQEPAGRSRRRDRRPPPGRRVRPGHRSAAREHRLGPVAARRRARCHRTA